MIILLDTSTPQCNLKLMMANGERFEYSWLAERSLAKGLHAFIYQKLQSHNLNWQDIAGVGVMRGPGSYTGLRIGLTVANTLADSLGVPIVGKTGENWVEASLQSLDAGENDKIVLPEYGGEANITTPRK